MAALVEVKDICKIYNPGENEVRALDHVSVSIQEKEFVAIIGHSGSGKSTLMNLSLIHISEPTRLGMISYAVFCLKKKHAAQTGCCPRTCRGRAGRRRSGTGSR